MCVDANAGARARAEQENNQRIFNFKNTTLMYHNREAEYAKLLSNNYAGYSRTVADFNAKALYQTGQAKGAKESATVKFLRTQNVNEGGRSRRFGLSKYQDLLKTQANIDRTIENIYGRNEAIFQQGALRDLRIRSARIKKNVGLPPVFGLPSIMPPRNRLGGALKIGGAALTLAAPFVPGGAFALPFLKGSAGLSAGLTSLGGGLTAASSVTDSY